MRNILRKLSVIFVIMTLCISAFATIATAAEDASAFTAREKAEGTVRFAVFSDSHLISDTSRLDLAFQSFSNIGGIDGVMMVGDIVYMNKKDVIYPERYTLLNQTINKYDAIKNLPIAYVMGNHEYPENTTDATINQNSQSAFIEALGLSTNRTGVQSVNGINAVYEMGGYTVVAASPKAYSNIMSAETESWAKEQILAAVEKNPNKPVFYLQHKPILNTVYSSSTSDANSEEFLTWIKTQKNVINFTAHCHYTAYEPRSIWQSEDGFTAIHSPLLGGGYMGVQSTTFERENIIDASYALMVEIDKDNVVKVYKLDLYNGEYVTSPYVIDVNSEERLYTDARYENVNVPEFQNGEAITVDKVDGHSVTISFPDSAVMTESVDSISNDTYVQYYKVQAINKATGEVSKSVSRYGDFWTKNGYDVRTVTIDKLDRNTKYEIRITPFAALNNKSGVGGTPLTTTITTTSERDATDEALITTKRLNVALHKTVTSNAPDNTYKPSNLTDGNRMTFVVPADQYSANDDWFMVDLEKRYVIDAVEIYDRYNQDDDGGRRAISIEGSNDPEFKTYDVLGSLADGVQNTLFPDNGCFTTNGNGKAYRYVRMRRTGGYYFGYSEIKVWANQDVTEVTRNRNTFADNYYASNVGQPSKAVNGTVSGEMDAWISEQGEKYHFITVDMESMKNIGLIEMVGRQLTSSTQSQRNYWLVYGSNEVLSDNSVLTDNAILDEAATGYTKLLDTGSVGEYVAGEYIFPEYPGMLQQVIPDANAYRYLTFKRGGAGGKGSTYLGELRGFELNPMIQSFAEANGVLTFEFSDKMDAESVINALTIYDAATETAIEANAVLSEDGYTLTVTPVTQAGYYKANINYTAKNINGVELARAFEAVTTPVDQYEGFSGRKDIYANVALNKPITNSGLSVYGSYPIKYANDGWVGKYATTDSKAGSTIGTGKGYLQIDLQNRYNLEKVEVIIRQDYTVPDDLSKDTYVKRLRVRASNDPTFATYTTLDTIGANRDPSKLETKGKWTINLDGTQDYRYLRVERTASIGEWGFAEIRAYAKFDAISLTKNATADSYYHYGKGLDFEAGFLPKNAIDGNTNTFHVVFNEEPTKPKNKKYTYLQVDLKNAYHVGYAELVARKDGYSGATYYQHFDMFGSNIGSTVTDAEVGTHPYLNTKWLESVEGYNKLSRVLGNVSLNTTYDEIWEHTSGAVYQTTFNDNNTYRYITHKTNSEQVGVEMSEMRLYSIAQRVNRISQADDGTVTLHLAGSVLAPNATEDKVSVTDKFGNPMAISNFKADGYTLSFVPSADMMGATVTVSKELMNQYAVPMAAEYSYTFPLPEVIENATLTVNGAEATALTASTAYTFSATYNNNFDSATPVSAYVVVREIPSGIVKAIGMSAPVTASGAITATVTTPESIANCEIDTYIWYADLKPIQAIKYFEYVEEDSVPEEVIPEVENTPAVTE